MVGLCSVDEPADAMCGKKDGAGLCAPGPPLRLCGLTLFRMGCGLRGPAMPEYAYCSNTLLIAWRVRQQRQQTRRWQNQRPRAVRARERRREQWPARGAAQHNAQPRVGRAALGHTHHTRASRVTVVQHSGAMCSRVREIAFAMCWGRPWARFRRSPVSAARPASACAHQATPATAHRAPAVISSTHGGARHRKT